MTRFARWVWAGVAAWGAACGGTGGAHPAAPATADCEQGAAEREFSQQPSAAVILILRETAAQDRVLEDLASDFELNRRYQATPALAGTLTRAGFERAKAHEAVRCVQLDGTGSGN